MPECGLPLPCSTTISTPEHALTITNNDGIAITGISARENSFAVFGRSTGNSVGVCVA
jgi:hypothetical protein